MSTKLTLNLEKSILDKAKQYAKQKGRSLSDLIENYLETITKEQEQIEPSDKLKRLKGSVQLPSDFNEEKELRATFEEKHL
jgi:uncharacterized protein (DUF3820 family)